MDAHDFTALGIELKIEHEEEEEWLAMERKRLQSGM